MLSLAIATAFLGVTGIALQAKIQNSETALIIDVAGRNRMLSQRISLLATQATLAEAPRSIQEELQKNADLYEHSIKVLQYGGTPRDTNLNGSIPTAPEHMTASFLSAQQIWQDFYRNVKIIANSIDPGKEQDAVAFIQSNTTELLNRTNHIVAGFAKHDQEIQQRQRKNALIVTIISLILFIAWLTQLRKDIFRVRKFANILRVGLSNQKAELEKWSENSRDEIGLLKRSYLGLLERMEERQKHLSEMVDLKTKELSGKLNEIEDTKKATLNILEDVQEEKSRNEALAEDLKKFRMATDAVPDHVVITDKDGMIIYANEAATLTTGYNLEEMLGKKAGSPELWGGLMSTEFYENLWNTVLTEKEVFYGEIINKKKDGTKYNAMSSISPILDQNGDVKFIVGIERDITKEKEHERVLKEANDKFQGAFESAPIGIALVSTKGEWLEVNEALPNIIGYSHDELMNMTFQQITHPDDLDLDLDYVKRMLAGEISTYQMEKRYIHKDGYPVWILLSVSSVKDAKGKVNYFISQIVDISKQKEVDKAKTEFVSLASHQLRTPLSAIKWYAEMLIDGDAGKLSAKQKEYLAEIAKGNKRMVDLVNSLLNVSRLELGTFGVEPSSLDLNEIIKTNVELIRPSTDKKEQVVEAIHDTAEKLEYFADERLMNIIIQNLLSNATKYSGQNGSISIWSGYKDAGDEFGGKELSEDSLVLYVKDDGMGIPVEQQGKIFQKLFRADNVRISDTEGTGLGLCLIKSIVEYTGGHIWFHSTQNEGTTFWVTLPASGMLPKEGTKQLSNT